LAYFLDGLSDLTKTMLESLGLKQLTKKALDKKTGLDVKLKVLDAIASYGNEASSSLMLIIEKSKEKEVKEYAQRKLVETQNKKRT
jgi:hypothetical protein